MSLGLLIAVFFMEVTDFFCGFNGGNFVLPKAESPSFKYK